jgi:hypothetical protein
LCLRCAREMGILPPSLAVQPLDLPVIRATPKPPPAYTRIVNGVEFDVVWNG